MSRGGLRSMVALSVAAMMLGGCSNSSVPSSSQFADGMLTWSQDYGSGGTKLPKNPQFHFMEGVSVAKEVTHLFGTPQTVESYDWGSVLTYRYWENKIGSPAYEESYDFVFNENGFLENVIHYVDYNEQPRLSPSKAAALKDTECPSKYTLCEYYER